MGSMRGFREKANQLHGCWKEPNGEKVLEGSGQKPARRTQRPSLRVPSCQPMQWGCLHNPQSGVPAYAGIRYCPVGGSRERKCWVLAKRSCCKLTRQVPQGLLLPRPWLRTWWRFGDVAVTAPLYLVQGS